MFHWLQNASELNCKNAREKPLQFESQIKSGLTDETFTQYNTLSTCGGTVETVCKAPLKQGNVVRSNNLNNFFSPSYEDASWVTHLEIRGWL